MVNWVVVGVAALVGAYVLTSTRPWIAAVTGGFALGPTLYFVVGVALKRHHGVSRFYSVPFGHDVLSDDAIIRSAAVWIVATGVSCAVLAAWRRQRVPH